MKAIQISAYGGNEVLQINADASEPTLAPGQVLVKVHAASLNPIDRVIRAGYLSALMPVTFPATLGGDFAGVVAKVGEAVVDLKAGDPVYGQAMLMNGGSGSLAQFVAANAANTALKPRRVSYVEAAALPLAGVSAMQASEEHIRLEPGQRILIHGGAGGVGAIAIQLAKYLGAYVATTVRADDMDYVRGLGADQVIDYRSEAFEEKLTGFDAVLGTVGGETIKRSFQVLRKGGILVSLLGQPDPELAGKYGVAAIEQYTATNTRYLNRLAELVDSGHIKVRVGKVFPLEQASAAFTHFDEGAPRGKVVVKMVD